MSLHNSLKFVRLEGLTAALCFVAFSSFWSGSLAEVRIDSVDPTTVELVGPIEGGEFGQLLGLLQNHLEITTVHLNSEGGLVVEALKIAELVRAYNLNVVVSEESVCLSACFYIAVSGRKRSISGRLGAHQIYLSDANVGDLAATQQLVSVIIENVLASGVNPVVLKIMFETPPDLMQEEKS